TEVHCADCDIGFDVHFGDNVEAVCTPNPRVRVVPEELHCGASAWYRPHVFALVELAPGGAETSDVPLPEGELIVRALGHRWQRALEPTRGVTMVVRDDGIELGPRPEPGYAVRNESGRRATIQIERAGWSGAIARGSLLLTMPEFLDLFATTAPATGRAISVGRITVLFVDIVGSTELYESEGDARAFAMVSDQLDRIEACVSAHGGAVVKTIGDAVMASFPAPRNALETAIETLRANRESAREQGEREVALRFGIHDGPCLMVGANERIDLFGGTVNLAARVQGRAGPGQIVVVESLLRDAGVMDLLATNVAAVDLYESRLKGLEGEYALAALAFGSGDGSATRSKL
ncbi:MAG: adenylate/guanylate cyclase domain-containing protein, partial [Polyangiaceae bacterium]